MNALLKLGWSRKSKAEYEHRAPREAVLAVTERLAEVASTTSRFPVSDRRPCLCSAQRAADVVFSGSVFSARLSPQACQRRTCRERPCESSLCGRQIRPGQLLVRPEPQLHLRKGLMEQRRSQRLSPWGRKSLRRLGLAGRRRGRASVRTVERMCSFVVTWAPRTEHA